MKLAKSKAKDTSFSFKKTLNIGGKLLSLDKPLIMGILNITPDSFYSDSQFQSEKDIIDAASTMIEEGAYLLDVGGYSTRPGGREVSKEEEEKRLISTVSLLSQHFPDILISADTFRASLARKAIEAGAHIINDVSGGQIDPLMFKTVGQLKVPYILMHMRGTSRTMQSLTQYDNILKDITLYFKERISDLVVAGVNDIIIDPGFGFAKTVDQNYELLKNLAYFRMLNLPILAGLSRKSMIYKSLGTGPEEALNGTTVLNTIALLNQASILRVHDVKAAKEAVTLVQKVLD
ncbi:dihydropteroate synthase [Bacteroidota bacterium]